MNRVRIANQKANVIDRVLLLLNLDHQEVTAQMEKGARPFLNRPPAETPNRRVDFLFSLSISHKRQQLKW